MHASNLVLSLPQGIVTATSLGIAGLADHRSPGSGKYFHGRSILVDLATRDHKPAFDYLPEGDWRDAAGDSHAALAAVANGKRTKTALSNNGFSCTPVAAWRSVHLVKTSGHALDLESAGTPHAFGPGVCSDGMTPDDVARAAGLPVPAQRIPRLYMTICPIEFVMLSNLTPAEYAWYATHRPGKKFRQVAFAELTPDSSAHLAAGSILEAARHELAQGSHKKTKTIVFGEAFNRIPFSSWVGYDREAEGGLYVADAAAWSHWRFPEKISRSWERAY